MIRREIAVFLVVGTLTVLVDFITYRGLLWSGWVSVGFAKGTGFLCGTVFAYFANRFWTFGHKSHAEGTTLRFAGLYAVTLGANVSANSIVLTLLGNEPLILQIAFLAATGVSAVLNFVGMKLFVFSGSTRTEAT